LTRLLLVRHGAVAREQQGRYWGKTDVPLSDEGRQQARALAARLRREPIATVYASDLCRALDTAAAVAEAIGRPVAPCPELREIDFGELEGLTFAEVTARYPGASFWSPTGPGYPGGESLADLTERAAVFRRRLAEHADDEAVLVVAHGGSLIQLICLLLGLDPARWWQIRLDYASLTILETYPEGAVLTLLNDTCHLDRSPSP